MKIDLITDDELKYYIAELNGLTIEEVNKMNLIDVLSQIEGAIEAKNLCAEKIAETLKEVWLDGFTRAADNADAAYESHVIQNHWEQFLKEKYIKNETN